ncbi:MULTISPECIES: hypothetical protein [unclassified Streptomyces]|uniref:hypothetical protein n=1 Tax=unclassified Streptomyces TaxID=2593676 RepID=UPI0006AEB9FE|nr:MULTISPECIES: hypothetical protein [unclassified Streptomyces]
MPRDDTGIRPANSRDAAVTTRPIPEPPSTRESTAKPTAATVRPAPKTYALPTRAATPWATNIARVPQRTIGRLHTADSSGSMPTTIWMYWAMRN